ncbi:MAG TPA: hypothetical protein VFF73_18840, partial [Planctomycetota bacterium]|nr:hypothetical protein [Planctomycetota bacterium]
MRRIFGIAACLMLTAVFAPSAWADRCPFSTVDNPHDCDDPNPLKCKKCEEIAAQIAKRDPNVWTLDLAVTAEDFKKKYVTDPTLAKSLARKFGVPRRVEIKKELGASEVYWYVYYEVTNNDELERPCWIHVTAESDKGKNTVFYNDSIVPEVLEELKKIVGVKEGETLYTSTELCHPG